jgi:transcriptional regulator with XRE-family HTH domain
MADKDTLLPIGQQIRDLRKAKGISTANLATATGKSAGYINNIERGLSEVSLLVLNRISEALEVQLSWFFQGFNMEAPDEAGLVVRQKHRRQLKLSAAGVSEELLSPKVNSSVQMIRTTFSPAASSGDAAIPTTAEMSGVILSGELSLQIGEQVIQLEAGDSFLIPKGSLRRCINNGAEDSISIWVVTPPVY